MSDESAELDPLDEELVAYLDGEIDPTGRVRIERRLAEDDAFRRRLRRMQQTWEALDLLPQASVGDAFTSSTMTLVVAEQEGEIVAFTGRVDEPPRVDAVGTTRRGSGAARYLIEEARSWAGDRSLLGGPIAARNIATLRYVSQDRKSVV